MQFIQLCLTAADLLPQLMWLGDVALNKHSSYVCNRLLTKCNKLVSFNIYISVICSDQIKKIVSQVLFMLLSFIFVSFLTCQT